MFEKKRLKLSNVEI